MPKPRLSALILTGLAVSDGTAVAADTSLLEDRFDGASVNPDRWHIPAFTAAGDGTFLGRTQFRASPAASLPATAEGRLPIRLDSYNPAERSFLGIELISNQEFIVGGGLDLVVRARMEAPLKPGIVGGIFLYALKPGSVSLHDEIDFELLTNRPTEVPTNIYDNEPLGIGNVVYVPYAAAGSMTGDHSYEIRWTQTEVSWLLDGKLVRTVRDRSPAGPMRLYLNIWAPDRYWPRGYSAAIQPAPTSDVDATVGNLLIESVTVRRIGS